MASFGEIIRRNTNPDDSNGPALKITYDSDVYAAIEIENAGSGDALSLVGDLSVTGTVTANVQGGSLVGNSLTVDTDTLVVNASGEIGAFGATPVLQQNIPQTTPDLADVIAVLVNLGFAEQSDP